MKTVCLFLGLLLLCTGCANPVKPPTVSETLSSSQKKTEFDAQYAYADEILTELTHMKYAGRRAGSMENRKAGEYLAEQMAELGLAPWNEDSYLVPYQQPIQAVASVQLRMHCANGKVITPTYGSQFSMQGMTANADYELPVLDVETMREKRGACFVESRDGLYDVPGLFFERTDPMRYSPFKILNEEKQTDRLGTINLQADLYDEMIEQKPVSIEFLVRFQKTHERLENVVGVIPGEDRSYAMVLCAHFDGQGDVGDQKLPSAYDNASGVAATMEAAARLLESDEPYGCDIIICATNGEETGLQGSSAFRNELDSKYISYAFINIDSIGGENSGPITITPVHPSADKMVRGIVYELEKREVASEQGANPFSGDHYTFLYGSSVDALASISDKDVFKIAHSTNDLPQVVDRNMVGKVGEAMAEIVRRFSRSIPSRDKPDTETFSMQETEEERVIQETLAFNEVYIFEQNQTFSPILNGSRRLQDNLFENFPDMVIPDHLYGLPYKSAYVVLDYKRRPEDPINKAILLETKPKKINTIFLFYTDGEEAAEIQIFRDTGEEVPPRPRLQLDGKYDGYFLNVSEDLYFGFGYEHDGFKINVRKGRYYKGKMEEFPDEISHSAGSKEEMLGLIDQLDLKNNAQVILDQMGL